MSNATLFIEMFPVVPGALPKLAAYRPTDAAAASPRTATKLARQFDGQWAWGDGLVLTDKAPRKSKFDPATESLEKVARYKPSPVAQAAFLIQCMVPPLADHLAQALQAPLQGNFRPLSEPTFKAWAVDGTPAISIGMVQRLIYRLDLAEYAATIPNVQGLVGMTVMSRAPWVDGRLLSGVVVDTTGTLGDQRDTLTRFARTEDAKKRLERAPDGEVVVKVRTFFGEYDFPAHALHIVLGKKDYARLRVDADAARQASYQNIAERARMVAAASGVLKAMDYIGDSYKSNEAAGKFFSAPDMDFSASIRLGDGQVRPYAPRKLWDELSEFGMFSARQVERPVRIGIVNALGDAPPQQFDTHLIAALKAIEVPVANVQSVVTSGLTPDEAQTAFKRLDAPDAVVVFIPNGEPTPYSPADDWAAFVNIKREILAVGVPSICVFEKDMSGKAAAQEHALMLALAVGYTPFALGEPLAEADFVAGLTVMRGQTSMFVTSVYRVDGVFVGYILHKGALDTSAAATLFPAAFFGEMRLVLHTADTLRDEERTALQNYCDSAKITLHTVQVGTGANPRLYAFSGKSIVQPPTGSTFALDGTRGLLVPALPAHPAAASNPLLVEASKDLALKTALRSLLEMNLLHPQAKKPRLPITLHYSERIRRLVGAQVMPARPDGALAWWL